MGRLFSILFLMSLALILIIYSSISLALTAPGTLLRNQAELTYFDPLEVKTIKILSNVSKVIVSEYISLTLDTDKILESAPGLRINIPHRLTNVGNVYDTYDLELSNLSGDSWDLADLSVYVDVNGNGLVDQGEVSVTSLSQLIPGDSVNLVISGTVPSIAKYGDTIELQLKAISESKKSVYDIVEDKIKVIDGANIIINKQSSTSCDVPLLNGQSIKYKLGFTNVGNRPPQEREILVNNVLKKGVLIEDPLPANTTLSREKYPISTPIQGIILAHVSGSTHDQWIPFEQFTDQSVDRIGVLIPAENMLPNQSGSLEFDVTINSGLIQGTFLRNTAVIDFNGDGKPNVESNQVCNLIGGSISPKIQFQRPSNVLLLNGNNPRHEKEDDFQDAIFYKLIPEETNKVLIDGVYLKISASQLNLDINKAEFSRYTDSGNKLYEVDVKSKITGDSIRVVVKETGKNTGIFRSVYPLVLSSTLRGKGKLCPLLSNSDSVEVFSNETTKEVIDKGCVLNSAQDDILDASFRVPTFNADGTTVNETIISDRAFINPAGKVFDSSNGRALPSALVSLYQSKSKLSDINVQSCTALTKENFDVAIDPISGEPLLPENTDSQSIDNTVELGSYQFPLVEPGYCYYLEVQPPIDYDFPSELSPDSLGQYSTKIHDGSYGFGGYLGVKKREIGLSKGAFLLDEKLGFPDIPLDPVNNAVKGKLIIDKVASDEQASVGDVVSYSIEIKNNFDKRLLGVKVFDKPAYGFRLIKGSVWVSASGVRYDIPDPQVDTSAQITFDIVKKSNNSSELQPIEIKAGDSITLNYSMRLSAGALESDGINRAIATGKTDTGFEYTSNQDEAKVEIINQGVLSDQAIIFGKVYVDSDCNNLQSEGEWPIAGVKLYLQDGTWVITDEDGQYSLFGRKPEMHTIKVDPLTLPKYLTLKPIDNRNAADGESRFVDLRAGELHRADFAAACPPLDKVEEVHKELARRNKSISGDWLLDEASRFDPFTNSNEASRREQVDGTGGLGSGVYTKAGSQEIVTALDKLAGDVLLAANIESNERLGDLQNLNTKTLASKITRSQAQDGTWLWPKNNVTRDGRLQVVIPGGLTPSLYVNGVKVAKSHLGEQVLNRKERAQVVAWYGVPMTEGENDIEVVAMDSFGNKRVLAKRIINKPGSPRSLKIESINGDITIPADGGRSTLPLSIKVLDKDGVPALGSFIVSLETNIGVWLGEDIQPETPGHQVRVEDGSAIVHFRSTERTGKANIKANADSMSASIEITQVAPLRPLVSTGFIQGRYSNGSLSSSNHDENFNDLDGGFESRMAGFIKGSVLGDSHLTLAFDSDNELDESDQIRNDLGYSDDYLISGDASVSGYDARSKSKLYLKLEKDRNSVMWGDYLTDSDGDFNDLGRVQRTLTGLNAVFDNNTTKFGLFGALSEYQQVTEELPGNGTAMLFKLSNRPRRDTETLEMIIRDRNNKGLVVDVRNLIRNVDYSINYFTGDIRFFDVIPTYDENGNFVYIRANYELEDRDAKSHLVAGGRLTHKFTDNFSLSLGHTRDEHETEGYDLSSSTAKYEIDESNYVYLSIGSMKNQKDGIKGNAVSIGSEHYWEDGSKTYLKAGRAEQGFRNNAAGISESREEVRIEHKEKITPNITANIEGIHSNSLENKDRQTSLGVIGDLQLGSTKFRAGLRGIDQVDTEESDSFTTGIVGVDRTFKLFERNITIGSEYEQDFSNADRSRIVADVDFGLTGSTSLYSRYELQNSLNGVNQLNEDVESEQFTLGMRSAISNSTDVFSEYRLNGAQDGRDIAAANGVRSSFEIEKNFTITPTVEVITAIDGSSSQESTAASLALEDLRDSNRRTIARVETRFSNDRTYYGLTAANIWRINGDLSAVVRDDLRLQDIDGQKREGDNIVTLGLAHRPRLNNRLHSLYLYKWKESWGGENANDKMVHILSTHQNYQVYDNWILSGRIGAKMQSTEVESLDINTSTYVADTRLIWDISRRVDIDLHAGLLSTQDFNETSYSYGAGVNYLVNRNLRLGIGYNVKGFDDEDLDPQGYNAQGIYIGFDFKFDENSFDWLSSTAAGVRSFIGD
ncbi:outer membrane protein [Vibrio sp. ArtGut-C1]|uniref:outer membrane protein n=1 Tax=Vibrio sp. ArtGut-C1 TaxID=2259137 RepID=UPI001C1F3A14|nr:porin family protein [Vibrio sp. ArtGut-C1]